MCLLFVMAQLQQVIWMWETFLEPQSEQLSQIYGGLPVEKYSDSPAELDYFHRAKIRAYVPLLS